MSCVNNDETWLWHKKISHTHMDHLNKLVKYEFIIGLPKIKHIKDKSSDACKGKQTKVSFKQINIVLTLRQLQFIHMDLFGPSRTRSFGEIYYVVVFVVDFLDILELFST